MTGWGGIAGGVGPAESLKSGNNQQSCIFPAASCNSLTASYFLWLQVAGRCRRMQAGAGAVAHGCQGCQGVYVSDRGQEGACWAAGCWLLAAEPAIAMAE